MPICFWKAKPLRMKNPRGKRVKQVEFGYYSYEIGGIHKNGLLKWVKIETSTLAVNLTFLQIYNNL